MLGVLAYCCFISTQVFTGALPFGDHQIFVAVLAIMEGQRPPRPTHPKFTEDLWKLVQRCWDQDPRERPEASETLNILLTPSPYVDRVVKTDAGDQSNGAANDHGMFPLFRLRSLSTTLVA